MISKEPFILIKPVEQIQKECLSNYEQHKNENTATSSNVPWTEAGTYKSFKICVRYYRLFNGQPSWAFNRSIAMSTEIKGGFESLQGAIDAAIQSINTEDEIKAF